MKLTKSQLREIIREEIFSIKELSTNVKDRFSLKFVKQIESLFKRGLGVKRVVVEGPGGSRVTNRVSYFFYVPHPMHGDNLMISNRITIHKNVFADPSDDYYIITVSEGRSDPLDDITASNDGALLKAVSTMVKKHKKLLTYTS
jgi:hypothetical protein